MRARTSIIVAGAGVAALVLGLAALAAAGGWTEAGARAAARVSARFSFAWFITAWSASSLTRVWPGGWRALLQQHRRAVGLGFALGHLVHLGWVLVLALAFEARRPPSLLTGGGLAYLLIAAMAVTSHDGAVRALGAGAWRTLHRLAGGYVLFVFTHSYLHRLLGAERWVGLYGMGLLTAALGLRLAAALRRRPSTRVA